MRKYSLKTAAMIIFAGGVILQLGGCGVLIAQTIAGQVVGRVLSALINGILDNNGADM